MKLYKILTIGILTFVSFNALAQQNSTVPAEVWMCELNQGYSMDDVRKVSSDVQKFAKKNDMKSAQWIFTTFMGDMNPNGFALMISCGVTASTSSEFILSLIDLSILIRPILN